MPTMCFYSKGYIRLKEFPLLEYAYIVICKYRESVERNKQIFEVLDGNK